MTFSNYYTNERRDILPFLPEKPVKTIEFGCGNGLFSAIINELFEAETWGVDINPDAVTEAGKRWII
jgi:ribosomal protein L11 methylase PrmA